MELRKDLLAHARAQAQAEAGYRAFATMYSLPQNTRSTWPVALEERPRPASMLHPNPAATVSGPMARSTAPSIPQYSGVDVNGTVNGRADQVDLLNRLFSDGTTEEYKHLPSDCVDDCSMKSCGDDCSGSRCTFGCTDSEGCDGSDVCTSLDCAESSYPNSFSPCEDDSRLLTSFGHAPGFGDDFSNQDFDAGVNDMQQCLWLMPGQPCGVSVPTRNALGQHVFRDHIEPQDTVTCPVETCAAVIKAQQASSHLMQQHNPESYACPVKSCGGLFLNHEELDNHLTTTHGILDCHWAGCEVSTKDPVQLRSHVGLDHLNFTEQFQHPRSPWWDQSTVPSHVHEHQAFQFTPQSSAGLQASPFDADRNETAQEGSASPFINIFTSSMSSGQQASPPSSESISSMSPGPGAFHQTFSPTVTQFNDPPYLNHHPEGNGQPGTDGEKSKCMWVTGGVPGHVCGMTFSDGNALQLHTDQCHVWPTGDKATKTVLSCDWQNCKRKGKLLQNKEKLRRHLFTHTGFWITTCKECPKRFNNLGALQNHARTHSGERPFSCDTCQQTFATEASLTIHKRSHTGEKPLSCPECDYVSADSSNMTKHKQIHQPHKYFCPICNKSFSRKGTMNRHLPTHDKNRKEKRKRTKQQKSVSSTGNQNRQGREDEDTMVADAEGDAEVHN